MVVLKFPLNITVHQCGACGYASTFKHHVVQHTIAKCPGSTIDSGTITLPSGSDAPGGINILDIDPNTPNNPIDNVTNICLTDAGITDHAQLKDHGRPHDMAKIDEEWPPRRGVVYLVTNGDMVAKIGMWTGAVCALKSRYRTYYLDPKFMMVSVADPAGVEEILKEVFRARGLHADKKRKRELVLAGKETEKLFVLVAAGGDMGRVVCDPEPPPPPACTTGIRDDVRVGIRVDKDVNKERYEPCAIEWLLDTDDARRGADLFCPVDDFSDRLKVFATRYGLRHSGRFGKDAWIGPFGRLGLKIVRDERSYRGETAVIGDWVVGVDFSHPDEVM
jgi:hypothetical protein